MAHPVDDLVLMLMQKKELVLKLLPWEDCLEMVDVTVSMNETKVMIGGQSSHRY